MSRAMIRGLLLAALAGALLCAACVDPNEPGTPLPGADPAGFHLVADAMQPACGTLDCHGQVGRNMRLYGGRGLRLDPAHNPADGDTTDAEYNASFASVVGLEPEVMWMVLKEGGRRPERLAMIRKGRGVEKHKGGQQMIAGDPLDLCITSWLRGAVDEASCKLVSTATPPGGP